MSIAIKLDSDAVTDAIPTHSRASSQARLVSAMEEVLNAIDAGKGWDRESLLMKYHDVANELADCLSNLDFIRNVAPQLANEANRVDAADVLVESRCTNLGDFRIIRELGRGGMGVVYEAEQLSIGRRVALKVLPFAAMLDKHQLNRFKNEARAAGTLDHPNIVPIYFVGCERGVHFYAMQLIEGQSLAEIIASMKSGCIPAAEQSAVEAELMNRPGGCDTANAKLSATRVNGSAAFSSIPPFESREYFLAVARLGIQAAEALDHAHKNGILHRDIKPANLLVDDTGKLWITDFGLARIEQDAGMTMTGDLLGTLRYMSPEQALAKRAVLDHRSDIYSLGVTLYELLTLQPAFGGDDRQELLRRIAFDEPRKPRQVIPQIPVDLETIVLKAIEKHPADRYATGRDLIEDLRRFTEDRPIAAKRPRLLEIARKWSRRNRSLVYVLVSALLVIGLILASTFGWVVRDRAARRATAEAAASVALDDAKRLIEEQKWTESLLSIKRAEDVLEGKGGRAIHTRIKELRRDVQTVQLLEDTRFNSAFNIKDRWPKYAQAFRDLGIDLETLDPAEAAARIQARPIRNELVMDLDNWAGALSGFKQPFWQRLASVARTADPDSWRNRLRDTFALAGKERQAALIALTESPESERLAPPSAILLTMQLDAEGMIERAERPLRATQQRYPGDVYVNFWLAYCLSELKPPKTDEAIRFYSAEIAVRPDSMTYSNLGRWLVEKGSMEEGLYCLEEAVRLDPNASGPRNNVGIILKRLGRLDDAIASYHEAIRLDSNNPAPRANLGEALIKRGLFVDAIASYTEAIRAYQRQGDEKSAKSCYADALKLLEENHASAADASRFRMEAERLLGLDKSSTKEPASNEESTEKLGRGNK